MKKYILNMEKILKSIQLHSLATYSVNDMVFSFNSNTLTKSTDSNHLENIFSELKDLIYHTYHCRKPINNFYNYSIKNNLQSNDVFVEDLSIANKGSGSWDGDWSVKETKGNKIVIEKHGFTLWANRNEFWCDNPRIKTGTTGYLKIPKEMRELSPGFYIALGNMTSTSNPYHVKIYWNIKLEKASLIMKTMTEILNGSNTPFQLKILSDLAHYPRSDSAVLYVDKSILLNTRKDLSEIFHKIKNHLNTETSFFSKKLANGVGLGEDVDNSEGFGQRISGIIAHTIIEAYQKSIKSTQEKISILNTKLQHEHMNIKNPYLLFSSNDDYDTLLKGVFAK